MSDGYSDEVEIGRDRARRSDRRSERGDSYEELYDDDRSRRARSRPRTTQYAPTLSTIPSGSVGTDRESVAYEHISSDSSNRRNQNAPQQRRSSQHSQARPIVETRQPLTQQSSLSNTGAPRPIILNRLCDEFVSIPYKNIGGCAQFAHEYPGVFDEATDDILEVAKTAFAAQDHDLGDRCVQRASMIKVFQDYPERSRGQYIDTLVDKRSKLYQKFWDYCHSVRAATIAEAAQKPKYSTSPVNILPAGVGGTRRPSEPAFSTIGDSFANLDLGNNQRTDSRPAAQTRKASFPAHETSTHTIRRPSVSGKQASTHHSGQQNDQTSGYKAFTESSNDAAGGYGGSAIPTATALHKNYKVRDDPREFFRCGRLFKVLWHMSVGSDLYGNRATASTTPGKFGEPIYSSLRWMLVVKAFSGHCVCCPISTYGRQGLTRKKFRDADIRAHACVYEDGTSAVMFQGEDLTKRPIPVTLVPGAPKIDPASRVHFGKLHTVEYNTKVLEIGEVPTDFLPYLAQYVRSELNL